MHKRALLSFGFLLVGTTLVLAQTGSDLYQAASPGVVYIQQAIKISPEYFPDTRLVGLLEQKLERKIVGDSLDLESGTGFFLDAVGHLVTNNHVIDRKEEKRGRENAAQGWGRYIDSSFSEKEMSLEDKRALKVALYKALANGPYVLQVLVGNKDFYEAKVLASNAKLDLALVEIPLKGSVALGLAADDSLIVGADVFSLGYPFGSDAVKKLTALSSSFTKGSVSAFREEKWIQHTATINFGNSGGPLLNGQGLVVGVNAALRTNANNTYFAIPVSTVRSFLSDNGFAGLPGIAPLAASLGPTAGALHQNSLGEYEVSSDLIFPKETGSQVFVDGVLVGSTPLFWNPPTSSFKVRIEGPLGYSEGPLRVLKSIQGSTEVRLPWWPYSANLTVTTASPGAKIFLDGKPAGTSPLTLAVPVGDHALGAQAPGMLYQESKITLTKDQDLAWEIPGEPVFPVQFQGSGLRPALKAAQGERVLTFEPTEDVLLPSGVWSVAWQGNDSFDDGRAEVTVVGTKTVLDAGPFQAHGSLLIKGLDPKANVLVDHGVVAVGADGVVAVAVGVHVVNLYQRGVKPVEKTEVAVRKGVVTEVVWTRQPSLGSYGNLALWTGVGGTVVGAALAGFGYYQYGDTVALAGASSYQDYLGRKSSAQSLFATGMIVGGVGVASAIIGLLLDVALDQDTRLPKPVSGEK